MKRKLTATTVADAGHAYESRYGIAKSPFASANQSASAAAVTDTPDLDHVIWITDLLISSDAAMLLTFTEETSARVVAKIYVGAGQTLQFTPRGNWVLVVPGKRLMVQSSASGNISILPFYYTAKP